MRFFANLFLILFVADGTVSLLHELVATFAPATALSGVREILAGTVFLLALPLYVCLGIDRRLPKRVFLPLIMFVFWCPLAPWFFPALAGNRVYGLLAAAAQVALILLPLLYFRKGAALTVTLPQELFDGPFFSRKNTLLFAAASLVVVPLSLLVLILSGTNSLMSGYSAGFMRLGPGGLHMIERVYRRDDKTIRLAGMIHVGEKRYYEDLAQSVPSGRTIVLAEGVTDDEQLLRNRFDYRRVAGVLGLTSQEKMLFRGKLIEPEELQLPPPKRGGANAPAGPPDILRADLDISDFRPPTILLLDTIGKYLTGTSSMVQAFRALSAWAEKNITPEMQEIITDDILHRRNQEVLGYLKPALDRYDTVIIPWGALHMKEIEEDVLQRGFVLQEERERLSIDFLKLLHLRRGGERHHEPV